MAEAEEAVLRAVETYSRGSGAAERLYSLVKGQMNGEYQIGNSGLHDGVVDYRAARRTSI